MINLNLIEKIEIILYSIIHIINNIFDTMEIDDDYIKNLFIISKQVNGTLIERANVIEIMKLLKIKTNDEITDYMDYYNFYNTIKNATPNEIYKVDKIMSIDNFINIMKKYGDCCDDDIEEIIRTIIDNPSDDTIDLSNIF